MFKFPATVTGWLVLLASLLPWLGNPASAQMATNEIPASTAFFSQVWQTEDGLPHNDVHGVVEGADGFLWVGTHRGLVRFDGTHFSPAQAADGASLAQASVWRMCLNNDGQPVAAFESGGLAGQNRDAFVPLQIGGEPYTKRVYQLCTDKLGRLWTVSLDGKVERIFEGAVKSLGAPGTGAAGPSMVVADRDGVVWLASKGTLGFFQGDDFISVAEDLAPPLFIAPAHADGIWLATAGALSRVEKERPAIEVARLPWATGECNVRDMLEDRSGALWLGTNRKGLIRFSNGRFQSVPISHNNILCLTEDRVGNIWVGTQGGGLNRVRMRQFKVFDSRRGLPNDSVFSFAEDTAGRLWLATQDGGLCYWSNSVITVLGEARAWPVLCLAADSQGGIWLGTQKNGLLHWADGQVNFVTREAGLKIELLNCLLVDQLGRVWAGSMLEGLFCVEGGRTKNYTAKDGLSGNGVRALAEDKRGVIWAGTDDGGLSRFADGAFQKFSHEHWPGDAVRVLLATDDDALWLGTAGGGLIRFKNGAFKQVNSVHGLPDDPIQELMLDEAGWLWCGSSRGLFRARLSDLNAAANGQMTFVPTFSYGRSDGLSDFLFNGEFQPAACRTRAGKFWFASAKGAVVFQPDALPQNREPPNLVIESMIRNGVMLPPRGEGSLEPGVRRLEFKFVAPDFEAPERVRYRHKLEGVSADWSAVSAEPVAVYTNVPPGQHRFHVIACNGAGVWNEQGASLTFTVAPFFWQTWWFPPLAVAIGVVLLAGTFRWVSLRRLRRRIAILEAERALEKERGRIAQDIHDELGANLTSIGWLADLGQKHQAQPVAVAEDLEKIAATARESLSSMDAIVWALNPHNESSENFVSYVAHYADEFFRPTGIRCRLDIPIDLRVWAMANEARHHLFLAVKEALNNAAKHSGAKEVWLRFGESPEELRISIVDNGHGLPDGTALPGQDGLANIRRRLELLGGNVQVQSAPGTGTILHFFVPWRNLQKH